MNETNEIHPESNMPYRRTDEIDFEAMRRNPPKDIGPTIQAIIDNFPWDIFGRSSMFYARGELAVAHAFRDRRADVALEFGTYNGVATAVLAQYAKRVITIDIKHDLVPPENKFEVWRRLGINDRIRSFIVNNETEKENLVRDLAFDFAYLDGNHFNYTYSDWMMTRHCGRILFHEYWERQPPVWDLVNSLPKEEVRPIGMNFAYWERRA